MLSDQPLTATAQAKRKRNKKEGFVRLGCVFMP